MLQKISNMEGSVSQMDILFHRLNVILGLGTSFLTAPLSQGYNLPTIMVKYCDTCAIRLSFNTVEEIRTSLDSISNQWSPPAPPQ